MAPMHRSPDLTIWMKLIKQMRLSLINGKPVGIVQPPAGRRDVKQRQRLPGYMMFLYISICLIQLIHKTLLPIKRWLPPSCGRRNAFYAE